MVLLVLRLDFASLRHAQRTLDYLTAQLGLAPDHVQLVVNRYGQAQPGSLAYYGGQAERWRSQAQETLAPYVFGPTDPQGTP